MKKHLCSSCWIAIAFLVLLGCDNLKIDDRLSEGLIEYHLEYPDMDPTSMMADMMPDKMEMRFKDNTYISEVSAGFGMFRMAFVSQVDNKNVSQMVKLLGDKYVAHFDEDLVDETVSELPELVITPTKNQKEIAGFQCHEAKVSFTDGSREDFLVYYTEEIGLDKPNWFSQYSGINGVLLEYQIEMFSIWTRLSATNVVQQEIDETKFEVPEEYKTISDKELELKLNEIMATFLE